MAISLSKGANISLTKEAETPLSKITVGLGWDPRVTDGKDFDLDASVFLLTTNAKVRSDADFIFYNQKRASVALSSTRATISRVGVTATTRRSDST